MTCRQRRETVPPRRCRRGEAPNAGRDPHPDTMVQRPCLSEWEIVMNARSGGIGIIGVIVIVVVILFLVGVIKI